MLNWKKKQQIFSILIFYLCLYPLKALDYSVNQALHQRSCSVLDLPHGGTSGLTQTCDVAQQPQADQQPRTLLPEANSWGEGESGSPVPEVQLRTLNGVPVSLHLNPQLDSQTSWSPSWKVCIASAPMPCLEPPGRSVGRLVPVPSFNVLSCASGTREPDHCLPENQPWAAMPHALGPPVTAETDNSGATWHV